MYIARNWKRLAIAALAAVASCNAPVLHATEADFVTAVVSTHPLAYYRLDQTGGKSQVGATTYKFVGGVTSNSPGAPLGGNTFFAMLDGQSGYVTTAQTGGVGAAASIMAWVNLAKLPSQTGHYFYVAGESQNGNDLDLQFENDDALRFYTAAGGHLTFAPPPATLVNQWHLILATLDTATQTRVIYWDGKPVAHDQGSGRPGKTSIFTLGASSVFGGRFFNGGIQEAALWNRALKAAEVAAIYAASGSTATPAAAAPHPAAATAPLPTTGPFATKAKIEIEDAKGPVQLAREEQIAYMFMSAIEMIEHDCQLTLQHVCPLAQILSGAYPAGTNIERLKFDPNKTDPNYVYTLAASGMAWEAHANPKRPGLKGFCFMARTIGTTTATYNPGGTAGWTSVEIGNRGSEGDSFATQ
jgi:hypothetical protein